MKLSIIIPYYNTWELTKELLEALIPQMTDEVEIIIVEDGCQEWRFNEIIYTNGDIKCIHLQQNSGGASRPRNIGLEHATGEYITFIDSDDMVTDKYIFRILKAIRSEPDIIFLSWKSKVQQVMMYTQPPKWNCSVWCRVYKREIIGDTRFDEELRIAEDWKFNQEIKFKTKACIRPVIYIYNNGRKGSILNG